MFVRLIFFNLFFLLHISESARILAVVPTPSFSHQVTFRPIWNELGRRGHDVVVITTDPQNDPNLNIKEIDISFTYDLWSTKNVIRILSEYKFNVIAVNKILNEIMIDICHQELLHPEVQSLLQNESEHFDLVMVEYLFPIMIGFAEKFKAPYVGVVSVDLPNIPQGILGNPTHPIVYPDLLSGYVGELNFWQRLGSVAFTLVMNFLDFFQGPHSSPAVRKVIEEHFGNGTPSVDILMRNVSIILANSNPAFNIRPVGPAFVLFGGGTHLMPLKPLPQVIITQQISIYYSYLDNLIK